MRKHVITIYKISLVVVRSFQTVPLYPVHKKYILGFVSNVLTFTYSYFNDLVSTYINVKRDTDPLTDINFEALPDV